MKINPKKPLSDTTQIEMCLLALMHWKKVKPSSVNLEQWRCGTQACFGGHLATWESFKDMGVQATIHGNPYHPNIGMFRVHILSKYLFGNDAMFNVRTFDDGRRSASDYQVIVRRLERQIEWLSS
jgi:hypothetical protein